MAKGRRKPLYGSLKYAKLPLKCSVAKCDNEFYLAYPLSGLPQYERVCYDHYNNPPVTNQARKEFYRKLGFQI